MVELPTDSEGGLPTTLQDDTHTLSVQQSPLDGWNAENTPPHASFDENNALPWNPLTNERGAEDNSSPFKKRKAGWEGIVDEYLVKEGDAFISRLEKRKMSTADIDTIVKTLEMSAKDGVTYDKFLGQWRILSEEYVFLARTYPRLARAAKVSKTLRKAFVHDSTAARLNNSPGTALKVLENEDLLSDAYLQEEDKFNTLELHKKIEMFLFEKNIRPCQYAQVVYFHGDLPSENHEAMDDDFKAFGLSEEKVAQMLGIVT